VRADPLFLEAGQSDFARLGRLTSLLPASIHLWNHRNNQLNRIIINNSDSFQFRRATFYQSLKRPVGLAAAKAAALRINLNIEDCGVVAPPMHAPSRARLPFFPPSFFHTISLSPAFTIA
jgi:hypothetical protein